MGLSGYVGSGAIKGLEDILTEQMLKAKMVEEQRQAQAAEAIQQQRLAQDQSQFDAQMGQRDKFQSADNERADAERRDRNNRAGVADMMAQREAMDREAMMNAPKPVKLTRVTTVGPNGRPISKGVTDEELAQGVPEYREPKATGGGGGGSKQWLLRNGAKTYDVPQAGDEPYDAVAARQAVPSGGQAEAVDTAKEVQRIAKALREHPGRNGAFGVMDSRFPTIRQSTADAEVLRDSLRSLLTLENMGKMKGVLSDADMKVLANASTTLSANMSDAAAVAELMRLEEVMGRAAGGGAPSPVSSHGGAAAPKKFTILGVK